MTHSPPSNTSTVEEPLLPTHVQSQYPDAAPLNIDLRALATVDKVCDFLVRLLTSKRRLAPDHAHRIASKWTIGNIEELRNYPPSMYLNIFGSQDGWVVYKEVKVHIMRDEWSPLSNAPGMTEWLLLLFSLAAFGGVAFGAIHGIKQASLTLALSMFALSIPIGLVIVTTFISMNSETTPEKTVESELQECLKKHNGS